MTAASPRLPSVLLIRNRDISNPAQNPAWETLWIPDRVVPLTSRGSLPSAPSSCRNPCSPLGLCVFFAHAQSPRVIHIDRRSAPFIPNANEQPTPHCALPLDTEAIGWYSLLTIFKPPGFSSMGTLVVTMSPSLLADRNSESTTGRRRDPPRDIS